MARMGPKVEMHTTQVLRRDNDEVGSSMQGSHKSLPKLGLLKTTLQSTRHPPLCGGCLLGSKIGINMLPCGLWPWVSMKVYRGFTVLVECL